VGLVEQEHVEGVEPGAGIEEQDAGDDETAAGHEVEGQLHGGVFFAGGAPDQDEDVHGHDGDFVEQEEEEHVVGHEHAEDPGHQGHHPDKVFFGAVLQFPHGEATGEDDDPGEQQHGGIQAFDAHKVGDAEGPHPLVFFYELQAAQTLVIGHKGKDGQGQGDT
jgi:hypothetical protein